MGLGLQRPKLLPQPVLRTIQLGAFAFKFVTTNNLGQKDFQQTCLLALQLGQGCTDGAAAVLKGLRQPFSRLGPFEFVRDQHRLAQQRT